MGISFAAARWKPPGPGGPAEAHLRELFAANVLLQVADGFLTHRALEIGFGEGNPILGASIAAVGAGPALLLFKAKACGLLLLLRRIAPAEAGRRALWWIAVGYALFAITPWLGLFVSLPWAGLPNG